MVAALVAIRQGISVRIVEQGVVSIPPGKFLKYSVIQSYICGVNCTKQVGVSANETHLCADTQVIVWHKLWLLMGVLL